MQLAIALVIIASVLLPNYEVELSDASVKIGSVCSLIAGLIPILFAWRFSRCIVTDNVETSDFVRSLRRFERLFLGVWIGATTVVLGVFRWDMCVRACWPFDQSLLISQLAIFAPVLMPTAVFWWIVAKTEDRHMHALYATNDTSLETTSPQNWKKHLSFVWIQIRQMILLPAVPVLAILLIDDGLKLVPGTDKYRVVFFGSLVASLPFVLPAMLRRIWRLESLVAGETRNRIQTTIDRMDAYMSDICLWRTGNRCINAAVAGAFRRSRILLISDALLDSFNGQDLDAVVAHEMAHVKHRHVPTMLWSLVAAGLTAVMWTQIVEQTDWQTLPTEQTSLLILVPVLAGWLLVHRFMSRSFEHQADLEACRHFTDSNGATASTVLPTAAVDRYVQMLQKLAPAGATGSDWWHPSISARIESLQRIHCDTEQQTSFEMRITAINRMVRGSVIFLVLVTIGLALVQL